MSKTLGLHRPSCSWLDSNFWTSKSVLLYCYTRQTISLNIILCYGRECGSNRSGYKDMTVYRLRNTINWPNCMINNQSEPVLSGLSVKRIDSSGYHLICSVNWCAFFHFLTNYKSPWSDISVFVARKMDCGFHPCQMKFIQTLQGGKILEFRRLLLLFQTKCFYFAKAP